ncbi:MULTISPECIES: HK97 family phage prohead protease [unclassified Archaeoglobus]|jgi:HK97 family phage prohead protease|uniref:HK97 family phage prohead protease n=1 Tax=unclassified Archaeoglobus TaxID=2643606 RepID=UPI0025BA3C10|nr:MULTISPECIES: HK97 family phage prohead protease [unclassified Archaeoglobus]
MQLVVRSLKTKEDEKNVYVEGYASATVEDLHDEIITEEALQEAARDIVNPPYNKVFIGHAPLIKRDFDIEDEIPIGKVVDAAVKEDRGILKLWIKVMLNKAHPYFELIYESLKNGFLDAFSIGFKVLERKGNKIKKLQILEVSLVGIPSNPEAVVEDVYEKNLVIKGISPRHTFKYGKDEESPWRKPNLSDFTDEPWESLSEDEQQFIAAHFAWAPKNPPDRYTDLKFPHHNPTKHPKPHAVNLRGVIAGFVRLSVAKLPEEDKRKIYAHLSAHYKNDFGREPPEYRSLLDVGVVLKTLQIDEEVLLKALKLEEEATDHSALKSLNSRQENMEEVEKRVKELEATISELSEKVKELETKNSELTAENAKLKEENEKLANEVKQYIEREKAELIEKIKALTDEINEEELKSKDVTDLKEFYLTILETKVLKAKSAPPKVKVGGNSDEVSFEGVF